MMSCNESCTSNTEALGVRGTTDASPATFCARGTKKSELLSGLSFTLTTDKPVYQVGQTITITLTETNTGDQPLTVPVVPTDFTVRGSDGLFWQSNPGNSGQPPTSVTLQPDQSISQTATWDGTRPYEFGRDKFTLTDWGTFQASRSTGPAGLTDAFQINSPFSISLTTDKSSYDRGEPVVMMFTETNNGNQPVTVLEGPTVFDATWNGEDFFAYTDYEFLHTGSPPTWQTLLPGESYSQI